MKKISLEELKQFVLTTPVIETYQCDDCGESFYTDGGLVEIDECPSCGSDNLIYWTELDDDEIDGTHSECLKCGLEFTCDDNQQDYYSGRVDSKTGKTQLLCKPCYKELAYEI